MKVLLLNPPSPPGIIVDRRLGCTVKVKGNFLHPPIELAYVGSVLKEWNGCEVTMVDSVAFNWTPNETLENIATLSPKIIFYVVGSFTYRYDLAFLERIKDNNPDIITTTLGWHVSAIPEWYLQTSEAIDFIVVGEPELIVSELVQSLEKNDDLRGIKGLAFKEGNKIIVTPRSPPIKDLDSLPFPDRSLIKNDLYHVPLLRSPFTVVFTSRGCPFRCRFCGSKNYSVNFRFRSPENVVAEMAECIEKFHIKSFRFLDDTFTVNKNRVARICELIMDHGWDIEWACLSRVDTVDEATLKIMSKAGCRQIFYGVESGSPKVLEYLRKDQSVEDATNAFKWSRKAGILAGAYFILGTPIDDWSTINETILLAKKLKPDFVGFSPLIPFPGTEAYEDLKKQGKLLHEDWEQYIGPNVVFRPDYLTPEEISEANKSAYRQIHLDPSFLFRHLLRLIRMRQFTLARELFSSLYYTLKGSG